MEYVKICGLKDVDMVRLCKDHGANAVGFIYNVPQSPRNLEKEALEQILSIIPDEMITVIVFKPLNITDIKNIVEEIATKYYQVHCSFEINQLKNLSKDIRQKLIVGLKANESNKEPMIEFINSNYSEFFAFLIDSSEGHGKLLNYDLIEEILYKCNKAKIIIAGGINEENVARLLVVDNLFGIDVSSSLESEKGVKNPNLIKNFLNKVNSIVK